MPSVPRKSKGTYVEIPDDFREEFNSLAASNGRTFRLELLHAMRRHMDNPPRLTTPPIPDAKVEDMPAEEPRRKRGRPRKSAD